MRHKVAGRRLSRSCEHRMAMRRNMACSLFQHETISTTVEKAKEIKPFAEKLITLAKKGDLASRRRVISLLGGNPDMVVEEDGVPVKKGTIIGKLFSEIAPRYLERPGGYTRVVHLSLRRLGDNGKVVLLQLIGEKEEIKSKSSGKKKAKKAKPQAEVTAEEVFKAEEPQPEEEKTQQLSVQTEETESKQADTEKAEEKSEQ